MLISHEIPKQLFPFSRWINDYPYALGHLMSHKYNYDAQYTEYYKQEFKKHEFSILDNSAFELGEAISNAELYDLSQMYKPSHIILPDVAFNKDETKRRVFEYLEKYGDISTSVKFIACVQGQGMFDLVEMYDLYSSIKEIDIIAISACIVPRENKDRFARVKMVEELYTLLDGRNRLSRLKPIHLLGCKHPGEFSQYGPWIKNWIHSIDTSAPIVYGWNNFDFKYLVPDTPKPQEKLADNLDIQLNEKQLSVIANNVRQFRNYVAL